MGENPKNNPLVAALLPTKNRITVCTMFLLSTKIVRTLKWTKGLLHLFADWSVEVQIGNPTMRKKWSSAQIFSDGG